MASLPEAAVGVDPLEIVGLRDAYGVLSVYVDADPRAQSASRPAWVVAIENGLDEIRERVKAEGDRARWAAVFERLDALSPELAALLDPRAPGRGRALFATMADGALRTVSIRQPLATRVVLGEIADVRPLVAALDRGRPAGLVVVSRAAVQVFEQRLGNVDEVTQLSLDPDTSDWRELKGPAAGNPALAQHSAAQRDRFEHRVDDHRARLLDDASARVAALAEKRGWDTVVVAGDVRLAQAMSSALEHDAREVAVVDRTLRASSPAAVADALAPELEAANARREARLVERARDAALSGNAGVLGLAEVLTALNDGRVEHLLLDEQRDYRGARTAAGLLAAEGVVPPGVSAEELASEPLLADYMIERALSTDARVTPLTAAGSAALAGHDGTAALLRW